MADHRATLLPMILRKRRNWTLAERFANGIRYYPPSFLSREEAEAYLAKHANKSPYAGHAIQVTYRSCELEEIPRRRSGKRKLRR